MIPNRMSIGVGLAGRGRMGLPMLKALRSAGISASGFDIRDPRSYGDMASVITDDAVGFAKGLSVLITVVRDIDQPANTKGRICQQASR